MKYQTTAQPPSAWSISAAAGIDDSTDTLNANNNNTYNNNRNNILSVDSVTGRPNELKASDEYPIPPFGINPADVKSCNDRVEIRLSIDRSIFVADGLVDGRVDIICNKDVGVKLGEIAVYLCGFEETQSPASPVPLRHLFLSRCQALQSPQLAPTEAVVAGIPDEHGMWNARKGVTSFLFKLKLSIPTTDASLHGGRTGPIPSSFWCNKVGGVRYIVSATSRVKLGIKEPNFLGAYREIQVLEHAPCHLAPTFTSSPSLTSETCVEVGGWMASTRGEVTLRAECHVPDAGQESGIVAGSWVAGGVAFVTVDVQNMSKRKIRSIKLALVRRLKTFKRTSQTPLTHLGETPLLNPLHFSRHIVMEKEFLSGKPDRSSTLAIYSKPTAPWMNDVEQDVVRCKDWWHGIKPGEKRRMLLDMSIPIHTRSVRFGITVDVSYVLQVSATPRGCSPIQVEIPVTILHPVSLLTSLPRIIAPVAKESHTVTTAISIVEDVDADLEVEEEEEKKEVIVGTVRSLQSGDGERSIGKLVPSVLDGRDGFDVVEVTEFPLHDDETPILSRHTTIFQSYNPTDTLLSSDSCSIPSRSGTMIIKEGPHKPFDRHRTIIAPTQPQEQPRPSIGSTHTAVDRVSTIRRAGSLHRSSVVVPPPPPAPPLTRVGEGNADKGTWKASMLNELVELKKSLMRDGVGEIGGDEESDSCSENTDQEEEEEGVGRGGKVDGKIEKIDQVTDIERAIDDLFKNLDS
ncbi:hypothetical protein HDU67_004807 [Dinochytrium kinnereticum]|nr:hypothetical protein HDU67_004807 [Dinochytrium kinnereticum]